MTTAVAACSPKLTIDHAGCQLVVCERAGDAATSPCLLLIHGLGWDGSLFDPTTARALTGYRTIVPDLRGHGASSCPPGAFDITDLAADMTAVLDALAIERCAVLGFSLGAAIGLELARAAPRQISGLVLIAGGGPATPAGNAAVDAMLARAERDGADAFAREQAQMIWRPEWAIANPLAVAAFIERRKAMDQGALHHTFRASRGWDRDSAVEAARNLPSRVIAADADPFMSSDDARSLAEELGAPPPEILRPSGHMLPLELPDAFDGAVRAAIDALASAAERIEA